MRFKLIGGLVWLLASANAASAQPWNDSYKRGDYQAAAAVLQPLVFEHAQRHPDRPYPDARAVQTLGLMYAGGLGVPEDRVMACALFGLGTGAAAYQHGETHAVPVTARRLLEEHCLRLSQDERRESMDLAGCFRDGPARQSLQLGRGHRVEVGRTALVVELNGRRRVHGLTGLTGCVQQIPLVRVTSVAAPKGSNRRNRQFIEVFAWRSGMRDGRAVRTLEWRALEVKGTNLIVAARAVLATAEGSAWPAPPVPEPVRSVRLRMLKSGQVRWQTAGQPSTTGLIPISLS